MSPVERVEQAYARIAAADRPEVWIALRPREDALAEAAEVAARLAAGETLPLAGTVLAVKDNIDVAGLPTTAGARSYAYSPEADATAVARLRTAGAVVIGKTNLDQFATGLVGTRSPYGAVRNAWDGRLVVGIGGRRGPRDRRRGARHRHRRIGPGPGRAERHRGGQADQGPGTGDRGRTGLLLAGLRHRLRP